MVKLGLVRNVLFILFAVYRLQGALYATGSILSKTCTILITVISFFYFIKTMLLRVPKPSFYYAWTVLLFINVFSFLLTASFYDPLQLGMFNGVLFTSLSFYPFYYLAKMGSLKSKHLVFFLLLMFPIAVIQFISNRQIFIAEHFSDDMVNKASYAFVLLLPFIFLIRKHRIVAFALFVVSLLFIVAGAKRGAFFAGVLCFVLFVLYQYRTFPPKSKELYSFLFTIILGVIVYYLFVTILEDDFLIRRISSLGAGNSSGRDRIYTSIIAKWSNSDSLLNILFGFGFASSVSITGGLYAHNDWLELLSSLGLLGVGVYLWLFCCVVKRTMKLPLEERYTLYSVILIWGVMSLYSMWYTSIATFMQTILLAYLFSHNTSPVGGNNMKLK